MKIKFSILATALLFAFISIFTFCKDEDETTTPTMSQANVLVAHISPNAPGVDLLIEGIKQNNSPLTFPNNTGYLKVTSLTLEAGKIYTVFAKGFIGGSGAQALGAEIIVNQIS